MFDASNPIYSNETAARLHLESIRWAKGAFCPHCGETEQVYAIGGDSKEMGLWNCKSCRKKFTVTVGTIFERSHIPLTKWLAVFHLMCASKKGISAHQVHRMFGITYKSAWFMCHRVREAMREKGLTPLGGEGKTVEIDEAYIGGKEKNKHASKRNPKNIGGMGKATVLSLVERGGKVRSQRVHSVSARNLRPILKAQIDRATAVMTDDAGQYHRRMTDDFASHETVNHGIGEYVRGGVYTNTVESFFALLKRGINGTFHHVSQQHLKRYLAEFDFRDNNRAMLDINDDERTTEALKGADGKRLTYQQTH